MVKTFDRGDGLLVTHADYLALEAERDELKRRLDVVIAECCGQRDLCARTILAIAEGEDNG